MRKRKHRPSTLATNDPLEFTPSTIFHRRARLAGKIRDEALVRGRSGVHAPPEFATQPLRNTDEFYDAFGIVEGDPMHLAPTERIRIW